MMTLQQPNISLAYVAPSRLSSSLTSIAFDTGFPTLRLAAVSQPQLVQPAGSGALPVSLIADRPVLPDAYGSVKSSFKGKRDALVIHIQDAHINEEAQRNIANIIRHFNEKYELGLVNLEGATGELYTEPFLFPESAGAEECCGLFPPRRTSDGSRIFAIVERHRFF